MKLLSSIIVILTLLFGMSGLFAAPLTEERMEKFWADPQNSCYEGKFTLIVDDDTWTELGDENQNTLIIKVIYTFFNAHPDCDRVGIEHAFESEHNVHVFLFQCTLKHNELET